MPDAPIWLNTDDAAAYIGITPATLRRLVDRGEVVAFQIGRVRRYRPIRPRPVPRRRSGRAGELRCRWVSCLG